MHENRIMKWIWRSLCHAGHPTGFCGYVYPHQLNAHGASWLLFHSQTSCGLLASSLRQFCRGHLVFCQARCSVRLMWARDWFPSVWTQLLSFEGWENSALCKSVAGQRTGPWLRFLVVQTKPVSGKHNCDFQMVPSFDPTLREQHLPQCCMSSSTLITGKENSPTQGHLEIVISNRSG